MLRPSPLSMRVRQWRLTVTEDKTLLREALDIIAAVKSAHMGGFTLDSDDVAHMGEFLEKSKRFA